MSQQNVLAAGIWPCVIQSAEFGERDGSPEVQVIGKITDGPSAGRQFTYQDQVNGKSSIYILRSLRAMGWKGPQLEKTKSEVAAWVKTTGGVTTVEIKHIPLKRGKRYDEWVEGGCKGEPPVWDKPNAIGRGAKPLTSAKAETLADANEAMRRAMEQEGGAADEPPADDDSIPFASAAIAHDINPIVKVLR